MFAIMDTIHNCENKNANASQLLSSVSPTLVEASSWHLILTVNASPSLTGSAATWHPDSDLNPLTGYSNLDLVRNKISFGFVLDPKNGLASFLGFPRKKIPPPPLRLQGACNPGRICPSQKHEKEVSSGVLRKRRMCAGVMSLCTP